MPISKHRSAYHQTLICAALVLGITAVSAGLFVWLNQQGLDHSWQQEYHEPSPWSAISNPVWRSGARIEDTVRGRITAIERALMPYQDIMSETMGDDGNDDKGSDRDDDVLPPSPPPAVTPPPAKKNTPSPSGHTSDRKTGDMSLYDDHGVVMLNPDTGSYILPDTAPMAPETHPSQPVPSSHDHEQMSSQTAAPPQEHAVPAPQPVPSSHDHTQPAPSVATRQNPDVHHVLFIGDSMMQGVAPHVITVLRRHYHIQSYDLSLQSTGLAYPNFYNWPETLKNFLEQKPDIQTVVVFLGPNDPWDMPSTARHKHYLKFRSPEWEEDYRGRIRTILNIAKEHGANVIWIGPPATKRKRLSDGIFYLDQLFQSEVEQAGQQYISVDNLFGYHNHIYIETMKRDGHDVRLRSGDGTHFNVTGQKIIAAAVMKLLAPGLGAPD